MGLLVRRAEPGDQRGLTSLVSKAGGPAMFRNLFGSYNFGQMIETSYLSVSALSSLEDAPFDQRKQGERKSSFSPPKPTEVLVGFAILSDTPRAGLSEDWLEWFSETHAPADAEVTMTNTLWVDFAVAISSRLATGGAKDDEGNEEQDDTEAADAVESIVRTVFNTLPEIDYLVMSLPGNGGAEGGGKGGNGAIPTPKFLLGAFELLARHADASPNNLDEAYGKPLLLLCDRMAFLPTLAVRPACVEDHDDLMPVFAAQSDLLSATYGEFFLADMIELQDDENKVLIMNHGRHGTESIFKEITKVTGSLPFASEALAALVQGRACGLLATSSDLELGLLQSCFQLDDYEHLVKMSPETRTKLAARRRQNSEGAGAGGEADVDVQEPPRIVLLGPPGAGKTTIAALMAAKYGSVLISVDAEAKAAAEAGLEQGERAMKLLDAGEVLPDKMVLDLVSTKLADRECQRRGWVLEGVGTAGGADELEEAIVMATEVGMEDSTITRPNLVIVLDLQSEADVLARVSGRRVDISTGNVYHTRFRPPPAGGDDAVVADTLSGDGSSAVVTLRLESYQSRCDAVVRTFAVMDGAGEGGGAGKGEGDGVYHQWDPSGLTQDGRVVDQEGGGMPHEGVVEFIRGKEGGAFGCVLVLDAKEPVESILNQACSAVDAHMIADRMAAGGVGGSDDGGSIGSATLSALPPNAFAVTLFCLESRLESRAADFLPHAFLLYPDRDYCVLTLPSVGAESVLLRHFTPVPARPGSAFNHVLYVMHRDSLPAYKYLRVSRFLGSSHRAGVSHLVECWGGADHVMATVKDADQHQSQDLIDNPPSAAFVATLGHQVVGVFVVSREACGGDELARIRAEFHVEDFIAFDRHRPRNQAVLTALALNPIFAGHCRFALKEVMRLYDKSVIYWRSPPGSDLPAPVPWHMIPVRPRHRMQPQPGDVPTPYTGGGARKRIDVEAALYFLSRRFVTEPKITANRRVVVVGASSAAVACLEGLVFTPYLNLTSITLVSPDGIPSPAPSPAGNLERRSAEGNTAANGPGETTRGAENTERVRAGGGEPKGASGEGCVVQFCLVDEDAPSRAQMDKMGLERHVRVVRSRMVHLDRENGAILLPDGSVVPYDVLVLCTGLQDDTSRRLGLWAPGLNPADPDVPGFVSLDSPFLRADIKRNLADAPPDSRVVIYASALKALCAAQGLVELGVCPERISFVKPLSPAAIARKSPSSGGVYPPEVASWSLGDMAVDAGAAEAAAASRILDAGYGFLEEVRLTAEGGIAAAVFATLGAGGGGGGGAQADKRDGHRRRPRSSAVGAGEDAAGGGGGTAKGGGRRGKEEESGTVIECGLLLCGDTPNADPDVFRAANNSGLVYDGRLVVDPTFKTSDPAVLAGGTLTKFSRVYGPDAPRHEKYNAREIGTHLAACVLQHVDPVSLVDDGCDPSAKIYNSERYIDGGVSNADQASAGDSRIRPAVHTPPLPRFERPRCVSGKLPGGLCYVRAILPASIRSEQRGSDNNGGGGGPGSDGEDGPVGDRGGQRGGGDGDGGGGTKSFTTGAITIGGGVNKSPSGEEDEGPDPGVAGDYCMVRLDSMDRVCDVIYCGREAVEAKNLSKIVGVQLGYLQGLEAAFEKGEVSSWIEFFRRGSLTPLYHDRFPQLSEELRGVLADGDEAAADLVAALDKAIDEGMGDEWLSVTIRKAVGRGASELPPATRKTAEARALEWVRQNRAMLPRLALPHPASHAKGGGGGNGDGAAKGGNIKGSK